MAPLARQTAPAATAIHDACRESRKQLLDLLSGSPGEQHWDGCLCASPLAAATAICALAVADRTASREIRLRALQRLAAEQTDDGGWGDLPGDAPNLPATLLGIAAWELSNDVHVPPRAACVRRAGEYIDKQAGTSPQEWLKAFLTLYGEDRSFVVPILMTAAAAGLIPWRQVPRLPLELVLFPRRFFRSLRLQVVSYALPALIAVGWALHRRGAPSWSGALGLRGMAGRYGLRMLPRLQPESGGFLEAVPLTAFVVLALAVSGQSAHPSVARGVRFLHDSMRSDFSWPIDVDLNCWVTSLSAAALAVHPEGTPLPRLSPDAAGKVRRWLVERQWKRTHPYTGTAPGGWAWTSRPGGVPDADDTAAALIALARLGETPESRQMRNGVVWLLDLQNPDGGWPTFCRGWGHLPFDQSTPDITAHAIRAFRAAGAADTARVRRALQRAARFLRQRQKSGGYWTPLWFGNPWTPNGENPVYGTALVLRGVLELGDTGADMVAPAVHYLLGAQHGNGGWGGAPGAPATIEETGAALTALAEAAVRCPEARDACRRAAGFLARKVASGDWRRAAPIGLYFAHLRYSEMLYPVIWTVSGLSSVLAHGLA